MKKIKLFREFVEILGFEPPGIDDKMQKIENMVAEISNGTDIIYRWENRDNHELIVNFIYYGNPIRYEFDLDNLTLDKYIDDELEYTKTPPDIEGGISMIKRDIEKKIKKASKK
jgi:hypothetical protein